MTATPSAPLSPAPLTEWNPQWLPAYVSNGVLGMRLPALAVQVGTCVLNGFAGLDPETLIECAPRAPFPLALDLSINGVQASLVPEACHFASESYDFSNGEVRRTFKFVVGRVTASVEVLTFCSRTIPSMALQEIIATVDTNCELTIQAGIDTAGLPGRFDARATESRAQLAGAVDGALRWTALGDVTNCGAAYLTECDAPDAQRSFVEALDVPLKTTYKIDAVAGRCYRVRQFSSMVPNAAHNVPDQHAVRVAAQGKRRGFEALRQANRQVWNDIWRARPVLVGAGERWQRIADASFYYLHASVHPSSICSTSLFGLAQWPNYNYYYGHPMWDLETFCVPVLSLTRPDCAEALLHYRSERLSEARSNAKLWGYKGAQFPWESSLVSGDEASPGGGSAAAFEHHVSLDIALAFLRHSQVSGNESFMRGAAWPVVRGVGEWLESRVNLSDRGYEIRDVNGVAERKQTADNNAFINMSAKVFLRAASAFAGKIGEKTPARWQDIAERLVLPMDSRGCSVLSHDGFSRDEEQGEAPEPLAGIFPVGYELPADIERATLKYYLSKKGEGYIGSPMLSPHYGVWAARLGDRELSEELFEKGFADFIQEPFLEPDEYSDVFKPAHPRVGPFFANLGGFLSGCYYGLGRLVPSFDPPQTWASTAAVLPRSWESIEVERVWVRGQPHSLHIKDGRKAEFRPH